MLVPTLPRPRRVVVATLTLVVAGALAGCSGAGDPTPAASVDGSPDPSTSTSTSTSGPATSASPSIAPGSGAFPTYVALGDSFTAAPGVPTTETDDGCDRSSSNYPTVLAAAIGARLTDVSCAGASSTSLVGVQQTGSAQVPPQFDSLGDDTSLVTLGMGGNDLDLFTTAIVSCLGARGADPSGHPCRDANADSSTTGDALLTKVRTIQGLITASLRGVVDRSPSAEVVLVGYPQPIPASGTCSILPLATGDYAYLREVFTDLDRAMATAARRADATFVDLAAPSRDHSICASDPWVNGIMSVPGDAIAFHPFAEEQQAIAGLVAQAIGTA